MPEIPNFFIVGIPKSGTTSLAQYLGKHPNVFMSTPKELNYLTERVHAGFRSATTEEEYLEFFSDCSEQHLAVGEASVRYCLSPRSIERVREYNSQARIILMVRNPIQAAISLHSMLRAGGDEDRADFEAAWRLQDERRAGKRMPRGVWEPDLLQYFDVVRPALKLKWIWDVFPRDQVMVPIFDDLASDPQDLYRSVLSFLGVPIIDLAEYPVYRESVRNRWQWLARLTNRPPSVLYDLVKGIRARAQAPAAGLDRIRYRLNTWNRRPRPSSSTELSDSFRRELCDAFRPEVEELSSMIGRDLTKWVTPS